MKKVGVLLAGCGYIEGSVGIQACVREVLDRA